jgi:hypothetical protein
MEVMMLGNSEPRYRALLIRDRSVFALMPTIPLFKPTTPLSRERDLGFFCRHVPNYA